MMTLQDDDRTDSVAARRTTGETAEQDHSQADEGRLQRRGAHQYRPDRLLQVADFLHPPWAYSSSFSGANIRSLTIYADVTHIHGENRQLFPAVYLLLRNIPLFHTVVDFS